MELNVLFINLFYVYRHKILRKQTGRPYGTQGYYELFVLTTNRSSRWDSEKSNMEIPFISDQTFRWQTVCKTRSVDLLVGIANHHGS